LKLAYSSGKSMEMLQLSDTVITKLCSQQLADQMHVDNTLSRNIADLILISMSKNQQHVKAIAANSQKNHRSAKPLCTTDQEDDVEQ